MNGKLLNIAFWWHVLDNPPIHGKPLSRAKSLPFLEGEFETTSEPILFGYQQIKSGGVLYWVPSHLIEKV
jgi:hypothetical protein